MSRNEWTGKNGEKDGWVGVVDVFDETKSAWEEKCLIV